MGIKTHIRIKESEIEFGCGLQTSLFLPRLTCLDADIRMLGAVKQTIGYRLALAGFSIPEYTVRWGFLYKKAFRKEMPFCFELSFDKKQKQKQEGKIVPCVILRYEKCQPENEKLLKPDATRAASENSEKTASVPTFVPDGYG